MAWGMDGEVYLSEPQWRRIDHELLVHGYFRKHSKNAPSEMVHLCQQFTKPPIFASETDDPINSSVPKTRSKAIATKWKETDISKQRNMDEPL